MDREKILTECLSFPMFEGREYFAFINLMSQILAYNWQRFCAVMMCHYRGQMQKSVAQILQKSPAAHYLRIQCHNNAVVFLPQSLKSQRLKVFVQLQLKTTTGLRKQYVIAVFAEEQKSYLIDHTPVWEKGNVIKNLENKLQFFCAKEDIFD